MKDLIEDITTWNAIDEKNKGLTSTLRLLQPEVVGSSDVKKKKEKKKDAF